VQLFIAAINPAGPRWARSTVGIDRDAEPMSKQPARFPADARPAVVSTWPAR